MRPLIRFLGAPRVDMQPLPKREIEAEEDELREVNPLYHVIHSLRPNTPRQESAPSETLKP